MSDSISTQHASSSLVHRQGSVVKHRTAEIWFSENKLVVDSRVPLPDLTVREFARPRIIFESASYYVSEKSQSTSTPTIYRYVLTPWPKNEGAMTRTIILDEEYLSQIAADRRRTRRESLAFKALVIFYPFLGFLWSPPETLPQSNRIRVSRDQQPVDLHGLSHGFLLRRIPGYL